VQLDVSNADSVKKAFEVVKAALPEGKGIWGVMNNAGILGALGPIEWNTVQDYKDVAAINMYGLIDVSMTFLPLVKLEHGRIVNTASVFGRYCLQPCTPYSVSKYGVEAFTDGLRRSLYPFGVKAILIEPGIHKTNISSLQNSSRWLEKTWSQCSPETKEEYGEDWYKYYSTEGLKKFDDVGSERVSDVVDAYHHALLGRFPRARYMPGKDAKFLWMPLQWMPEWLGDFIMFKFDPKQPLPAALRKKDQ
jgi:retinol dehydrogenase-16